MNVNEATAKQPSKSLPFHHIYWDFLLRHETALDKEPAQRLQVRSLTHINVRTP